MTRSLSTYLGLSTISTWQLHAAARLPRPHLHGLRGGAVDLGHDPGLHHAPLRLPHQRHRPEGDCHRDSVAMVAVSCLVCTVHDVA